MNEYIKNRNSFYAKFPHFWSNLNKSEYSLYQAFPINEEQLQKIRVATERMGIIYRKTARLLRQLPDQQLVEWGFPSLAVPYLKGKVIFPESVIGRFDFAVSSESVKLLEFNSDTPTFIKECFHINGKAALHFGLQDPNKGEEAVLSSALTNAVLESARVIKKGSSANIVFTAHSDYYEDWQTTVYLSGLCQLPHQILPLSELQISDDGLIDREGKVIDVLYRQTYPLEHLVEDQSADGDKIGIKLLQLVKEKKLAIVNPLSAFLMQPKTVQALIWGLSEENQYFNSEESSWIKEYMLPTYLEPDPFKGKSMYVQKPSIGREGDSITIFDKNNKEILSNKFQNYLSEIPVFQQYAELPQLTIETEKGSETLSYIFGSFLIAEKASAIGIRAGNAITGNESYFLPAGLQTKEELSC